MMSDCLSDIVNSVMLRAHALFVGQTISQLMIIPSLLWGSVTDNLITVTMYMAIVTLGISVGYHRYLSHSMFECNRFWQFVLTFFAHIMMVGSAIEWVSQHREHHRYSDTESDPHSPTFQGWFKSHFLQVYSIPSVKYAVHLLRLPEYRFQHKYYWHLIASWAMLLYVIDPSMILHAWLAPAGLAKVIGSLIYSFSHRQAEPHNDTWLGLITGGEGWHANHHTNAKSYQWHRLDSGAWVIDRIATNVKHRPYKII